MASITLAVSQWQNERASFQISPHSSLLSALAALTVNSAGVDDFERLIFFFGCETYVEERGFWFTS